MILIIDHVNLTMNIRIAFVLESKSVRFLIPGTLFLKLFDYSFVSNTK